MRSLTDRERHVIIERHVERRSLDSLAKELGITRERVRQIENNAIRMCPEHDADVVPLRLNEEMMRTGKLWPPTLYEQMLGDALRGRQNGNATSP